VKLTEIEHVAFTASVAGATGHVFVWAKSPALAPVIPTLLIVNAAVPEFFTVTDCEALFVPISCGPNVKLVGDSDTADATPVPLKPTLSGLSPASSVTCTAPVRGPVALGEKLTLIVQLALGASEDGPTGQLLDWLKSPDTATLLIVSAAVPELVSVTGCEALVVPTR
jgi:hypothetical protein